MGRRDTMVKLRGQRVELGEIEDVLLRAAAPLLAAVAVTVRKGDRSNRISRVTTLRS